MHYMYECYMPSLNRLVLIDNYPFVLIERISINPYEIHAIKIQTVIKKYLSIKRSLLNLSSCNC